MYIYRRQWVNTYIYRRHVWICIYIEDNENIYIYMYKNVYMCIYVHKYIYVWFTWPWTKSSRNSTPSYSIFSPVLGIDKVLSLKFSSHASLVTKVLYSCGFSHNSSIVKWVNSTPPYSIFSPVLFTLLCYL